MSELFREVVRQRSDEITLDLLIRKYEQMLMELKDLRDLVKE